MTTTRVGKIGRLPKSIRDQVNRRFEDGEPAIRLAKWLNSLPETRKVLAADFGGRDINEQNLTEWKQGGYREWHVRQELLASAGNAAEGGQELSTVSDGSLAGHLAAALSARYAALMSGWNGEMDDEFRRQVRDLGLLCQDIVQMRRSDHHADRLRLDHERFAQSRKDDQSRALEGAIDETQQWPDVYQAMRRAFLLLHQRTKLGIFPDQEEADSP